MPMWQYRCGHVPGGAHGPIHSHVLFGSYVAIYGHVHVRAQVTIYGHVLVKEPALGEQRWDCGLIAAD